MYIIFFRVSIEELHIISAEYVIVTDIYKKAFFITNSKFLNPNAHKTTVKDERNFINNERYIFNPGRQMLKPKNEANRSAKSNLINAIRFPVIFETT